MVTETTNRDAQLIPDRHPQYDLFICDVSDAVLKDVMQQLDTEIRGKVATIAIPVEGISEAE